MAIILSQSNVNVVEMLATRIEVQWDFRTNTGPVLFFFDRVDWDREAYVNERHYHSTVRADISRLIQGTYTFQHPVTGEEITEPAWKLMAMIKAATERAWQDANTPPESSVEEPISEDPLEEEEPEEGEPEQQPQP